MNVLMRMGSLSDWVYLDKVSHSNIILPKHISWYSFSDPRSSFNWSIKSLTFASLWRINFNFLVSLRTLHVISMLCFWSSASWSTVFVSMNLKLYFLQYPGLNCTEDKIPEICRSIVTWRNFKMPFSSASEIEFWSKAGYILRSLSTQYFVDPFEFVMFNHILKFCSKVSGLHMLHSMFYI